MSMYSEKHSNVCRVCGGPAVAGETECPSCRRMTENWESGGEQCTVKACWDNASHAGAPVGYRIIGGKYGGTILKGVSND